MSTNIVNGAGKKRTHVQKPFTIDPARFVSVGQNFNDPQQRHVARQQHHLRRRDAGEV